MRRAQLGAGLEPDLVEQDPPGVAGTPRAPPPAGRSGTARASAAPCSRSRSGCARTRSSSSPSTAAWRPVGQRAVDRGLARLQPEVLEPPDLRRGERLVGEVVERRAAPQRERLAQRAAVLADVSEALEAQRVDGVGVDAQLVAAPARDDLRVGARELLAQLGDEHLHELRRRGRRPVAPQPLDQPVGRDRGVGVQREDREQRARLRAAQRQGATIVGGLDQTQKTDLHGAVARREPNRGSGARSQKTVDAPKAVAVDFAPFPTPDGS